MAADWRDYRTPRGRLLVFISDVCIVGASVAFALSVGRHWQWGPFVLGPVVGVLGFGAYALLFWILVRVLRPNSGELTKMRQGLHQRNLVILPTHVSLGLCTGVIAGSLGSYWPDLALASMVLVVGLLAPLALLPLLKRKAAAARSRE